MNPRVQRGLVWCGPVLIGVGFVGLIAAGWFPPPAPGDSAEQTARVYRDNTTGIRVCALLTMAAGGLFAPFVAVISAQLRRIEGSFGTLAGLQLAMGAVAVAFFMVPSFLWIAAAFDPRRDPQITEALHSAGWLPLVAAVVPLIGQNVAIAIATFTDRRAEPVFPRWVGYFNVWVALLFLPSCLVLFFHDGPFAWNGIFTFWLGAGALTTWLIAMLVVVLRAIARQEADTP